MVNINIIIPDNLHKKMKIAAAMIGISIKQFVQKAIEEKLKK